MTNSDDRPTVKTNRSHTRFRVRPMQLPDIPRVHRLETISQPAPWPRWFFRRQLRSGASCWVLEVNGEIIGFGIVDFIKDWAHIMNMCVAPAYRRHGLGRRMLLLMLRVAEKHRCRHAWLEVRPTNHPAISLYSKLGFRVKQIRKGYYRTRKGIQNGLVMVRPVRSPVGVKTAKTQLPGFPNGLS